MRIIGSTKPENVRDAECKGACTDCDIKWRGDAIAHCKGCHETFSSDSGFFLHRRAFKCTPPEEVKHKDGSRKLFYDEKLEVWKHPTMPSEVSYNT
jgi:hypothetical protein